MYTEAGVKIGTYTYDAWGNCTTTVASGNTTLQSTILRTYNPFRYRGYFYDTETGLYYLQSRYYNPATGRFLNADGYVNANGDLIGFNMYAYCSNNPVMYVDPTGEFALTTLLVGAAIGFTFSLANQLLDDTEGVNWGIVAIDTISGGVTAVVGPIAGATVSTVAGFFTDAIAGADTQTIIMHAIGNVAFSMLGSAVDDIVRNIKVKKLMKAPEGQIKQVVTSIDHSVKGSLRNYYKDPQNWPKELKRKIFDNILSTSGALFWGNIVGVSYSTCNLIGMAAS